jgi:MFS family permease
MNNKIKIKNPLLAPFLSLAFIVLSSAAFTTFISIKMQVEGFTETLIGIVQSGFYFGYLIGSLKAENIIRRVGYIRSFVFFAALFGSVILVQGLYINVFLWTILRSLSGLSIAALYVIIESWFLSSSNSKTRGRVLSIYMIAIYASQSLSQLLIRVLDLKELTAFLVFGILCYLSIIPVSINYSATPETDSENIIKKSYREVYKSTPFSFWACLISGLILSSIYSFLPIFAKLKGLSVSYIMTTTIAGGFLLQWPIGYLSDIVDRRKVLIVSGIFLTIPSLLLYFNSDNSMFAYILCFLLGGFSFVIYPITVTNASERFDIKYIPFVVGLMSLLYGIGATAGPFLTSLFMERSSAGIFLYISIMSILLTLLGIYFRIKNPKVIPQEEKNEFVPIPTAPIGSEITAKAIEENKPTESKATFEQTLIQQNNMQPAQEPVIDNEPSDDEKESDS